MMPANKPLSAEEAAKLLSLPTRASSGTSRRAPGSAKTTRIDLTDRSWQMWWKLYTTATECTVPNHDHLDEKGEPVSRKRMCAEVGDYMVCRYCYTTSRDRSS